MPCGARYEDREGEEGDSLAFGVEGDDAAFARVGEVPDAAGGRGDDLGVGQAESVVDGEQFAFGREALDAGVAGVDDEHAAVQVEI